MSYFKMEIALDEKWTKHLFKVHELYGSSNTPISDIVELALQYGIVEMLEKKGKKK